MSFGQLVSMKDYEDIGGFGIAKGGPEEVDHLTKALSAGFDNPPTSGGGALRVESLEATLRVITFTQQNLRLWRGIPKLPAYNTVEEFNLLEQYAGEGGAFTNEGDLPETQDSIYSRQTALVKFQGTTGEITHPMLMVRPAHGNVQALETQNKATYLLEQLERALFGARSDVIAQEPDGLERQILDGFGITDPLNQDPVVAGSIVDKRGGDVTEDDFEDLSNGIVENYGAPTDAYGHPKVFSRLAKAQFPRQRIQMIPNVGAEHRVGYAVTEQMTGAGTVQFHPNIFTRPGRRDGIKTVPASATSPKAPAAPSAVAVAAVADPLSKFVAADAGTYLYVVTALNRFGESSGFTTAGVAVVAGDRVNLTITDGGGANPATGYKVYRSPVGGTAGQATLIPRTMPRPTAGAIVYPDFNFWLPGTGVVYMIQRNLANLSVRQLAPMLKIPLATVAASIRWMQLLYWCLIVYSPRKNGLIINVRD